MKLDNHDIRIPYFELLLERDLKNIPKYNLPDGFKFEFYKVGDRNDWIEIEKSAKEFDSFDDGVKSWNTYYSGKDKELEKRMVFVVNSNGKKVATATAFYDVTGKDKSGSAWLHWVAVKREYQGKGLSKPLIAFVMNVMRNLGYTHVKIPTQTITWLAVKIYLDFGFMPISENAKDSEIGWNIIKTLTNHKSLEKFNFCDDIMLIDITDGVNLYQYKIFDEYKADLSQYQSRIIPDKNAELICRCYICCDCKIIGSIWIEKETDGKAILGIFIADDKYRGKGIGSKAIKKAINKSVLDEVYLHVRTNNQRAINCYHKIGFKDVKKYTKENGVEVIEMKYCN